jgi:hypothetical protein
MPGPEPSDPAARAEWARLRRRAAATHHPDRGGDSEAYLLALAAIDEAFGVLGDSAGPPRSAFRSQEVEVRRTWRGSRMRVARRGRRMMRTLRRQLPASFPGAERTTDI